ncbi:MAG: hypothetical protein HZB44_05315 [Actinobacteria bacterium]|nr:hypothetical protein [Actinomycetota bacterium]
MESMYWGIDVSQIIFGVGMLIVLVFFAVWGIRVGRGRTGGTKPGGTKTS